MFYKYEVTQISLKYFYTNLLWIFYDLKSNRKGNMETITKSEFLEYKEAFEIFDR